MTTTTARYALNKIVLSSDVVDVVNDFNVNWDAIDLKLGAQVCTSSTRPSAPVQGMEIYETDTGASRAYSGSVWENAVMVATSASRPANPIVGDYIYETDTGAFAVYVGGGTWRYRNVYSCTSTTRPTAISTGAAIYESDTHRFLVNNAGTWENKAFANFVCTSSTHPGTPFQGLEIYETDTGLNAVYSGSNYYYSAQQVAPTQILSATTATVTFSSIPSAITRLILEWRIRSSASAQVSVLMRINGDTGSNYLWSNMQISAGTVAGFHSGAAVSTAQIGSADGNTASYFGNGRVVIDGWSNSTGFLTYSGHWNSFSTTTTDQGGQIGGSHLAVGGSNTSITLFLSSNSFAAGSQFSLYGEM